MIRTAGGTFDPADQHAYFIASNIERMKHGAPAHDHLLVAINEIGAKDHPAIEGWLDQGKRLFIDSGIFNLTMRHARAHDVPMNEALALSPDQIDGFAQLWDTYLETIRLFGDRSWGYIELDQGGRENKIKTRAKLEALGLRPVPVYHPLNDGWDYFDYLAERYDRICFGNVVQADTQARKRLVSTAWERRRKYPHLWIHLLGYTPNQFLHAFPVSSGDSSTWLQSVRWSGYAERANGAALSKMPRDFQYLLGSDPFGETGSVKATAMSAFGAHCTQRGWRHYLDELEAMGCTIYPAPTSEARPGSTPTDPTPPLPG